MKTELHVYIFIFHHILFPPKNGETGAPRVNPFGPYSAHVYIHTYWLTIVVRTPKWAMLPCLEVNSVFVSTKLPIELETGAPSVNPSGPYSAAWTSGRTWGRSANSCASSCSHRKRSSPHWLNEDGLHRWPTYASKNVGNCNSRRRAGKSKEWDGSLIIYIICNIPHIV